MDLILNYVVQSPYWWFTNFVDDFICIYRNFQIYIIFKNMGHQTLIMFIKIQYILKSFKKKTFDPFLEGKR